MKLLYVEGENAYFRGKNGRIHKAPKNKFAHGEIVTTSGKHYSQKNITKVLSPTYTEKRGWVYTENFINEQGMGGGCGMWINEDMYEKITDPKFILIAKRIKLIEKINLLKCKLESTENDLMKVEFALELSVPLFREATDSCKSCGRLFKGFEGGDPNKDLCDNCLSEK